MGVGVVVGVVVTLVVAGLVFAAVIVLLRATHDHQVRMAGEERKTLGAVLEHQRGMAQIEARPAPLYDEDPQVIRAPSRRSRVQIEPARDSWEEGY